MEAGVGARACTFVPTSPCVFMLLQNKQEGTGK